MRSLGLTHQMIAEALLSGIEQHVMGTGHKINIKGREFEVIAEELDSSTEPDKVMPIDEKRKKSSGWMGRGVQGSFLNDELFMNQPFTFKKLDAKPGEKTQLTIDGLTPHLIYRYGFYQGGEYRTDPADIADFFGLTQSKNPEVETQWKNCN